jgi:hypothetical protein
MTTHDLRSPQIDRIARIFFLSTVLLLFAGCSSPIPLYSGPPRSSQEIVRVKGIYINAIDGKSLANSDLTNQYRYDLLPGKHTVTIIYGVWPNRKFQGVSGVTGSLNNPPITLAFDAERGHSYLVRSIPGQGTFTGNTFVGEITVTVEDRTTGRTVATNKR